MDDVTSDAGDLRIGEGLDDQPVAGPVVAETAHLFRLRPTRGEAEEEGYRCVYFHLSIP